MDVTIQRLENCDVLKVSGRVSGRVSGATAAELEESLKAITDEGRYRIVFDMGDVSIISSVGLRVLIDIQRICTRSGRGQVVLASVSSHVDKTLNLAGYYTIFDVYDTLTDAVGNV